MTAKRLKVVLYNPQAVFFTMPLAFLCTWFFSITDTSAAAAKERAAFEAQFVRAQTGIGAEGAAVR